MFRVFRHLLASLFCLAILGVFVWVCVLRMHHAPVTNTVGLCLGALGWGSLTSLTYATFLDELEEHLERTKQKGAGNESQ